jgi:putative endonuclease
MTVLMIPKHFRDGIQSSLRLMEGGTSMTHEPTYFVYLLASRHYGTLYIGVTGDLISRVQEHRNKTYSGFTAKYSVTRLVWYEGHDDIHKAIQSEKTMKHWKRDWKINLIERENPHWVDLYPHLLQPVTPSSIHAVNTQSHLFQFS